MLLELCNRILKSEEVVERISSRSSRPQRMFLELRDRILKSEEVVERINSDPNECF